MRIEHLVFLFLSYKPMLTFSILYQGNIEANIITKVNVILITANVM